MISKCFVINYCKLKKNIYIIFKIRVLKINIASNPLKRIAKIIVFLFTPKHFKKIMFYMYEVSLTIWYVLL